MRAITFIPAGKCRHRPAIRKLAVLSFVLLFVLSGCTFLFFKPRKQFVSDPYTQTFNPEDVYFKSSDGLTLHGWYIRAKEKRGTILVCHGNVENISTHVKLDLWLVNAGYNLFIFDYRGYGKSEGSPDVQGINLDAEAALETLLKKPETGNDGIVVFGKSLGGAVAVYTVANFPSKDRIRALILDSAFSSYRRIAREKIAESILGWPFQYPLSFLVNDAYSPIDYIKKVAPVPVLIIHGSRDPIVSFQHGQFLFEAASEPKLFWELKNEGHVRTQANETTRNQLLAYLAIISGKSH